MTDKRGLSALPSALPAGIPPGPYGEAPPTYRESLQHPVVEAQQAKPGPYAYPPQGAMYPQVSGAYPPGRALTQAELYQQAAAGQYVQAAQVAQVAAAYSKASQVYAQSSPYTQMAGYGAAFPVPAGYPQQSPAMYLPPQAVFHPGQHVLVQNGFDAGARFDGVARPSIPPPPPGVAPNAAQLAASAGASVSLTQKEGSFLTGGTGGGYTFW
ncbi:uncharacterized protein LOC143037863 isoform X2 [Oratosquilla oratoria]|uniref:uncharacterized protein LOC143037863 isoform X2 n=1 Tax=Oratosquilla oratoria TaxID=337810 RepID=UPI003F777B31